MSFVLLFDMPSLTKVTVYVPNYLQVQILVDVKDLVLRDVLAKRRSFMRRMFSKQRPVINNTSVLPSLSST